MTTAYIQCELHNGNRRQLAFIPEKYAVAGSTIKIRESGEWEDGWRVFGVFQSSKRESVAELRKAEKRFETVLEGHH